MLCPECNAENRVRRRFCAECGASLVVKCAECGFSNEPEEKFCGGCGTALSRADAEPTVADEETPAPAAAETPQGERRQITVMFCDLVGSTALSERLDPEDLREVLRAYQQSCADVIERFDGHVAKYIGDGLLIYFGYPLAHEDDAARAVRAGLGIVESVSGLSRRLWADRGVDLRVRVGIHRGLVVVGEMGGGEAREEHAIVGETPNIAARLQELAEPNTVAVSGAIRRLVEGLFIADALGPQRLKGISAPVEVFLVRAESGVPSRFEATARKGLTPLVGREEEVGLLLKRWRQANDGEGQVVLLSGEAGVGKSRIIRGFRERLGDEAHNRILFYCSRYHRNSALYPAVDQLERALRLESGDGPEQKLDKLEAALGQLGLPVAELAPLHASLLSIPPGTRYPPLELGPEQLKQKTLEASVTVIEAMARQRPVLMVVEDGHWIDPSTLELLGLLIERLRSARVLLVVTFRPEFAPPWAGHAHVTQLALNRLSRKESAAMVAKVSGGRALPQEVWDEIVAKTDGVPLFVEELTKMVLESGLVEDAGDRFVLSGPLPPLAIPASLQDSLMARLDRLAPVKEVAQLAATIGRTFGHELLAAVSTLDEKGLQDALARLAEAGLVYRRGVPPEASYEFKHALVQDAAYQSLLKSARQYHHERIARTLEERFPETAESQPELLAHHYTAAGRAEQAVGYWLRAGRRAARRSANLETIAHLTKGLDLVSHLPDPSRRVRQELDLQIALGTALMATEGFAAPEVGRVYGRARELCRQMEAAEQLFPVTWGLWVHHQQGGRFDEARDLAEELLALAERRDQTGEILQAHHAAWTTLFNLDALRSCRDHAEQGVALYNIEEHRAHAYSYGGHDPGVCALNHVAMTRWFLGHVDESMESSRDAATLALRLSHPLTVVNAHYFAAQLHHYRREPGPARERAEKAIELCAEYGLPHYAAAAIILRGWSIAAEGEVDEGIAEMQKGLAAWEATGARLRRPYFLTILAEAYGRRGETEPGLGMLAEALDWVARTGERRWEPEIHRVRGQLLLSRSVGDHAEAETCFAKAMEVADGQGARSLKLRSATSLASLWAERGRRAEAVDLLAPVYAWFSGGIETADLAEAGALLDALS